MGARGKVGRSVLYGALFVRPTHVAWPILESRPSHSQGRILDSSAESAGPLLMGACHTPLAHHFCETTPMPSLGSCQSANNSPGQPIDLPSPPVPTLNLEQPRITPHLASLTVSLMTQQDGLQVVTLNNKTEAYNVECRNKIEDEKREKSEEVKACARSHWHARKRHRQDLSSV
ncbi:uncharacterized protein LACBIDRAFT_334174 [Laccaria bicolor S238N-H82]|uniref:Predicted protein n=1 Tax=Laccaria bicolor (strain S238N-H82 / ATCC MYA-4686) TaxID=486041 RepID=B0DYC0_LACBS|nr:uncharacterized protein LACBIDRAFT_334174 [Laccaria bicolor S238N-H82]EDR00361.1 predicted protein [Laccaria bicolor S238N-H82]|eukprot:XP_001888920.1 predicted protein [Laccaria bicolor S238N-H82]